MSRRPWSGPWLSWRSGKEGLRAAHGSTVARLHAMAAMCGHAAMPAMAPCMCAEGSSHQSVQLAFACRFSYTPPCRPMQRQPARPGAGPGAPAPVQRSGGTHTLTIMMRRHELPAVCAGHSLSCSPGTDAARSMHAGQVKRCPQDAHLRVLQAKLAEESHEAHRLRKIAMIACSIWCAMRSSLGMAGLCSWLAGRVGTSSQMPLWAGGVVVGSTSPVARLASHSLAHCLNTLQRLPGPQGAHGRPPPRRGLRRPGRCLRPARRRPAARAVRSAQRARAHRGPAAAQGGDRGGAAGCGCALSSAHSRWQG